MTSSPYASASTRPSRRPWAQQYHRYATNNETDSATRQLRGLEPASDRPLQGQLNAQPEEDPLLPQQSKPQQTSTTHTYNTYPSTKNGITMPMADATASSTIQQETKMTTSAHRRLQDVLNGPVAVEPVLPPPLASTNPRRTSTSANQLPAPPRLLRRSSSAIRLTTSLEGKATVVLEDAPPSSPPKPLPTPGPRSARRGLLSTPVDSSLWEFCCDNQSAIRSPVATPPQPSEATQALRLLRTRRNTIGSIPTLLRTLSQSQPTAAVAAATTEQEEGFVKTTPIKKKPQPVLSSSERKSVPKSPAAKTPAKKTPSKTPSKIPSKIPSKTPSKIPAKRQQQERKVITSTKKASRPKPLTTTSNRIRKDFGSPDSDKENHPPGAPFSPPQDPPKRRALGVSGKGALNSVPTPVSKAKSKHAPSKKPNAHSAVDEGYGASQETATSTGNEKDSQEAELFIGSQVGGFHGGIRLTSPRRVDELECVENLLRLRGGTWR